MRFSKLNTNKIPLLLSLGQIWIQRLHWYAFPVQLSSYIFMTNRTVLLSQSASNFEPIPNLKELRKTCFGGRAGCQGDLRSSLTFVVNSDLQNNRQREWELNSTIHQKTNWGKACNWNSNLIQIEPFCWDNQGDRTKFVNLQTRELLWPNIDTVTTVTSKRKSERGHSYGSYGNMWSPDLQRGADLT